MDVTGSEYWRVPEWIDELWAHSAEHGLTVREQAVVNHCQRNQ